jgi:hypothetical protein
MYTSLPMRYVHALDTTHIHSNTPTTPKQNCSHAPVGNVHALQLDPEALCELVQNVGSGGRGQREYDAGAAGAA